MKKRNRKRGKVDKLPSDIRETVDMMINNPSEYRYSDIVDFISENGYEVSKSSVARYAQALNASLEQVMLISNNFRLINEELAKYPDLDVSEALARLTNHKVMEAIQNLSEDSLKDVPPEKLIAAVPSLIKVATYKRDTDAKNRSSMDAAYDVFKEDIFAAMANLGALANYIDYEGFGRDIRYEEGGVFGDNGYVRSNGSRFVDIYDGNIENIPEEYRISSPTIPVRSAAPRQTEQPER